MNNYTRINYQDMLEDFTARLRNDERFKNMSSASIYYLFMEMLTGTFDMTNFYMQRTAFILTSLISYFTAQVGTFTTILGSRIMGDILFLSPFLLFFLHFDPFV